MNSEAESYRCGVVTVAVCGGLISELETGSMYGSVNVPCRCWLSQPDVRPDEAQAMLTPASPGNERDLDAVVS